MNTFFESSFLDKHGRLVSTAVWEMPGVGHRDILTSPIFRSELGLELLAMGRAQRGRERLGRVLRENTFRVRHNTVESRGFLR